MEQGRPVRAWRTLSRRALLQAGALGLAAACTRSAGPAPASPVEATPSGTDRGAEQAGPRTPVAPEGQADRRAERRALAVAMLCRDAWGAAPAQPGGRRHTIRRLMVHHSAVPLHSNHEAPGRFRGHQRHHQSQGWTDIAYHVGVDRRGHLYELREASVAGDTFTDYDPAGWLLVVAEGNFDEQAPTDEQLEGVAQALAWGAVTFGADPAGIASHRDHARTACPGDSLHIRVEDGSLPSRVRELVAAGGVDLRSLCGDAGRGMVADIEAGRA